MRTSVVVSIIMLSLLSGTCSFPSTNTATVRNAYQQSFRKSVACVCLRYVRSLPPRLCVTPLAHSFMTVPLSVSLSLFLSYKSQIGVTPEIFQHIVLIMAMIHHNAVKNNVAILTKQSNSWARRFSIAQNMPSCRHELRSVSFASQPHNLTSKDPF